MVAEQLSLVPVRGAVVVLWRVNAPDDLESVGLTTTDDEGAFSFQAPGPGVYQVQADLNGLSTPLSIQAELLESEARMEVVLLLPSALLRLALACQAGTEEKIAAVVGVVRDSESGVALPGTVVAAMWEEGRLVRRLEAAADDSGRYQICPPAGVGKVEFQSLVLGQWLRHGDVDVAGQSIVILDLDVALPSQLQRSGEVMQRRTLMDAATEGLSDLRGELFDQNTGAPVPYAVVRLQSTSHQAVSDKAGNREGILCPQITPLAKEN
jgi:hypothetical protein